MPSSSVPVATRLTLDFDQTRQHAGLLVLAMGCMLTGSYFFKSRGGLLALCWVMAINGGALSVYGISQIFIRSDKILGIYDPVFGDQFFSTYVNRNNAAGFLLICLGCSIGLIFLLVQKRKTAGPAPIISNEIPVWRQLSMMFHDFVAQLTFGKVAAIGLAITICCGIVGSASRGGTLALFGGAIITLIFFGFARKPKSSLGIFVFVLFVTLAASSYLGLGKNLNDRIEKLSEAKIDDNLRFKNWMDTSAAIPDYAVFGSGLGSYDSIHRLYRQDREEKLYEYAENQYYQTLIEAGFVGVLLPGVGHCVFLPVHRTTFAPRCFRHLHHRWTDWTVYIVGGWNCFDL